MKVQLDFKAYVPTRAHETDAGLDIYTPERIVLRPVPEDRNNLLCGSDRE